MDKETLQAIIDSDDLGLLDLKINKYSLFEIEAYPTCEECQDECNCDYKIWDVNQWYLRETIHMAEDITYKEIIQYLISTGYLKQEALNQVHIEDYDSCMNVRVTKTNQPLYTLDLIS